MYATISLCLVLTSAALSAAAPYYLAAPQQRQFFYPVVPQYAQPLPQYPAVAPAVAPASLPYRQVYYPSQTSANLVAPVPSVLRYPASASPLVSPFTLPAKQAVYLPGPGGTYVLADGGSDNSYLAWLNQLYGYFVGEKPAENAEKPSEGESGSAAENTDQKESPANEGEKEKEGEQAKPDESAKIKGAPQNYVLVGQPQFFGNYGLQRVNPAAVIPSADHGAISSYLLLKNYPGVRFAPQVPQTQIPQVAADAEFAPGNAALGYQKLLQASAARQQKEFDDDSSVTIDAESDVALKSADAETGKPAEADAEAKPEEEESGPTIAQVKPKAIAMAGIGGVASAAPVGTALVGPGGMAVSAPEATAVAGVKGAASGSPEGAKGVLSKATTKLASKALRTYQLANQNFEFLLNL